MDAEVFIDMRHRLGVSQTRLAEMLGVHPVTVNKWEHGANITKVVELAMWALIFFDERRADARPPDGGAATREGE